ncbi:MAG: DUF5076 domain-containing protein [Hyphomicrobiaceae bacterium]|nr:DUF5076 domain-containing protein [Hyphomicrobiaceae bacterium]
MDDNDFAELEELELPDGVHDAETALEVLRAWIADGGLHVIFNPETFTHDVSEWGRLLGDVAQHVAHAVELDGQMGRDEALAAMQEAFVRGIGRSTDSDVMSGRIKGRVEH